jgi:opacity protein-like surface antigen
MKKQRTINGSHGLAAAGATLLLAAANGHAQQFTDNEFVKNVYVGMDSGFAFQRNMAMDSSFNGSPGNITFNVGWTLNGNIGYRFSDYFAAELDTGVIWNSINKVGDQNLSGVASAHLAEIPVLPNLVFTDLTFAYQVEAGLKYSLSDNIDVGLGYKFVGTSTHSWTDNGINLNTAGTAAHILEASFTWRF